MKAGQIEICDYIQYDGVRVRKMATIHDDGFMFIDEARNTENGRVGTSQIVLNPQEAQIFVDGLLKLEEVK